MDLFKKATQESLLVDRTEGGQKFCLDLNSGELHTRVDPKIVHQLVLLAKSYGLDVALLELVTERENLEKNYVYWGRPYHKRAHNPDKLISLQEWLQENGYTFS